MNIRSATTRIIASRHFEVTPPDLRAAIQSVVPSWADAGKIVVPENSDPVALSFLAREISKKLEKPVIAICAGSRGAVSRILNPCFTPCASENPRCSPAAEGQFNPSEIMLLRAGQAPSHKLCFFLFGNPISKSPSPYLHNLMFALRGMHRCFYSGVACSEMDTLRTRVASPNFRGASITIPLKESVYEFLKHAGADLSEPARSAQAVNTISVTPSGQLRGDNTDIIALKKCIERVDHRVKTCLIIGTGGAARGAIYAAASCGFEIFVYGRNAAKLQEICSQTSASAFDNKIRYSLIIGCVPAEAQASFVEKYTDNISECAHIIEMAYIPRVSPLIAAGIARGARIVYGSEILLFQAIEQHEIWTASLLASGLFDSSPLISIKQSEVFLREKLDLFN